MAADQEMQEQFDLMCFQLVAQVGNARSCFVDAITHAEQGDFEGAQACLDEGDASFREGHQVHMDMLQREANGDGLPFRIIVLHAEDLMASAETLRIIAERFINVYKRMQEE